MFVCALVLAVGLAAVMGILYSNFDGQMRKELSKEAAYLAYGVEQQGLNYLKNIKDKSAIIPDKISIRHKSPHKGNMRFSTSASTESCVPETLSTVPSFRRNA